MQEPIAKLHPKVEQKVTVATAREMLYRITRMLCPYDDDEDPDVPGAIAALGEVAEVLQGSAQTATTEPQMKSVEFANPEAFMSWVVEQFGAAQAENGEVMQKRLTNLGKAMVLAKAHWEAEGETTSAFSIEMEEAYVGSAGGGAKAIPLTTSADQGETIAATAKALGDAMRAAATPTTKAAGTGGFTWPVDLAKSDCEPIWGKDS